jgi:hypothetical protein
MISKLPGGLILALNGKVFAALGLFLKTNHRPVRIPNVTWQAS